MENIAIFYRMLNDDLSPLVNPPATEQCINFLKERYPEYRRQLKLRLSKTDSSFRLNEHKEYSFNTLEPLSAITDTKVEEDLKILDFVSEELKIDHNKVIDHVMTKEDHKIYVELLIRDDYQELSAQCAKFYYYQVMLDEAFSDITRKLHEKVFKLKDEEQIRLHIRKYQTLITGYMKIILYDFIPGEERNSLFQISDNYTTNDIFKVIFQTLEDILIYLEKSFGNYIDTYLPVPYQSRLMVAMKHAEKLAEILSHLEWARLDSQLYEIVTLPFDQLGILEPLAFSYHSHTYHEDYLLAFYRTTQEDEPLNDKKVFLTLWQMNFNALKFFNYLTYQIHKEIKEKKTPTEKIELLYYYQKLCNQLPVKTQLSYNPNLLPLKDQMSIWLQEEINFLKRKLKYATSLSGLQAIDDKTLVKMSVPQLSLLVRAFFETGLVDGTRQELMAFVCRHYRTDQQENISVGSLKGKYYKVDTGTKRAVGRMMKKMLAHIEGAGKNY